MCLTVAMTSSICPCSACRARLRVQTGRRLRGHVDGPGQRVPVDEDVDDDWSAFVAERGLQAVTYVAGFFNTDAPGAERFGDTAEVRVGEVGPERDEARVLLLDIDEVQHSVVQDDVDDRGLALHYPRVRT